MDALIQQITELSEAGVSIVVNPHRDAKMNVVRYLTSKGVPLIGNRPHPLQATIKRMIDSDIVIECSTNYRNHFCFIHRSDSIIESLTHIRDLVVLMASDTKTQYL